MQDWAKNTLTVSWIGLCAGLVGAVTYKLFLQPDSNFLNTSLGAFMGAFFAFLFIRLADFLTRLSKRRLAHFNALVAIERMFNEHLATISSNTFVLDTFCSTIRQGMASPFNFSPLNKDKSLYEHIHNIEILTKLFSFNDGIRKFNNDLAAIGTVHQHISNGFMQGHLNKAAYKENAQYVATQMEIIIGKYGDQLKEEALELLAMSRLRTKADIPLSTRYSRFFLPNVHSQMDDKQVQQEVKKILKELTNPLQANNKD